MGLLHSALFDHSARPLMSLVAIMGVATLVTFWALVWRKHAH